MAKRKSASKQAVEGPPRSPKPQPASKNRSANTGDPGKASSKPPSSWNQPSTSSSTPQHRAPKPPQAQVTANRLSNRTKVQGTGNGTSKPQGANGSTCISGEAEGRKASQDRSMHQVAHKRGSGPNSPRKTQGHVPVPRPNVSLKPQAPKPERVQPVTGGKHHSAAPNTQKAQNRVPTSPVTQAHRQATNSGKNATNGSPKIPTPTQRPQSGGKIGPPKSTMSDWFLGPTKPPLPIKNAPPPPGKASSATPSAGLKGTGNRLSESVNPSGPKRNSPNQTNRSAKQPPGVKGLGLSGWLSSWLPTAEVAPVQATNKPMSNPNKAKGLPNGSHSKRIELPNSATKDGTSRLTNALKKDGPGNNKAHSESRHGQESSNNNKGNNAVSAKRSSLAEGQSLGWSKALAFPPKENTPLARKKMSQTSTETNDTGGKSAAGCSPKSSESKRHYATTGGVVTQKRQTVPLAQDVLPPTLSSAQLSPKSQTEKCRDSRLKQCTTGLSQKSQAAVPNLGFGWLLNQVSSLFSRTGEVEATNKPRQSHGAAPKPLAPVRQVSRSSKGDGLLKPQSSPMSGTRSYVTLLKEQTPDRHEGTSKLTQSDVELLQVIPKHATHGAQQPTKRRSVQGLSSTVEVAKNTSVRRKKEFPVRSSSSKVLSRAPRKTLHKGLLRQYSPTLIWRSSDSPKVVSAYSTLAASPLPSPPKNELRNKAASKTIAQNPDLFKITSPIKVDAFEKNLKDHPNQPFVKSVVRALRNGFWPWANTSDPTFPTTYDGSHQRQPITNKDKANFIQQQRNEEVALGRWSKPFGKKLLPGMHSSPIGAVPKSTPGKYRLIIDQSSGPHALNSLIPKSQVRVRLDNIHDLGTALIAVKKKHPKRKLTLFKSDVKSAYRQLPMHPSWQIKQVVSIDGRRYVDRCNTFGSRGGGWNWNAFASLVNWIGTEKKNIPDLLGYVDDNFGWEFEGNTKYYRPYKKHLPAKQTQLLKLWDELGIPHDEEKQLSGPCLPILGYEVDANAMTVKVPAEKKAKVVRLLRDCAHEGTSYTLKDLQSVASSVNAMLCLYPRVRSGLRGLFDEMAGKERPGTKLTVTKPVAHSLAKLADYLENAQPVPIRQKH